MTKFFYRYRDNTAVFPRLPLLCHFLVSTIVLTLHVYSWLQTSNRRDMLSTCGANATAAVCIPAGWGWEVGQLKHHTCVFLLLININDVLTTPTVGRWYVWRNRDFMKVECATALHQYWLWH